MIGTPANIKLVAKILARQRYGTTSPAKGWEKAGPGDRDRLLIRAAEILEAIDDMQLHPRGQL